MQIDILIKNAAQLITCGSSHRPRKGKEMSYDLLIEDGWVAIKGEHIIGIGKEIIPGEIEVGEDTLVIDASGKVVAPGFVDCYTHVVHGGPGEDRFLFRPKDTGFSEIPDTREVILNTVKDTRNASKEQLLKKAIRSLDLMLLHGVTTVEAKSGYGLNIDDEIKTLQVAKELDHNHPVDIVSTFMGAHVLPEEYMDRRSEYIDYLIEEIMPRVRRLELAEFCDVYCGKAGFTSEECRKLLLRAREMGYLLKIHADEGEDIKESELAGEMGIVCAEHILSVSDKVLSKMKKGNVIAVLLPGVSFNMNESKYACARDIIDRGLPVALATGYDPGKCPTENIQLIISLACLRMNMMPEEALTAVTVNGAHAVGRAKDIGSIEVGKKADVVIFDVPNIQHIPYHFGINHVHKVIKSGRLVVDCGKPVYDRNLL